jgi:RNA polymerase sigma factor (sigma-70 family)
MVWSIARSMGRSPAEAADVSQTVWLSLVEHLHTICQPERVGAWLATTTRRECLRVQQRAQRLTLVDDESKFDDIDQDVRGLDTGMLSEERDTALWEAFGTLPESSRKLLTLLMVDPPMSYQDISTTLDMPIGSIGPTRARVLAVLRREVVRRGVTPVDARL